MKINTIQDLLNEMNLGSIMEAGKKKAKVDPNADKSLDIHQYDPSDEKAIDKKDETDEDEYNINKSIPLMGAKTLNLGEDFASDYDRHNAESFIFKIAKKYLDEHAHSDEYKRRLAKLKADNEEEYNDVDLYFIDPAGKNADSVGKIKQGSFSGLYNIMTDPELPRITFPTYSYTNPDYIDSEDESIENGSFFEPSRLMIVHFSDQNIASMDLTKKIAVDSSVKDEKISEITENWEVLEGNKYAYTDPLLNREGEMGDGSGYFQVVELQGNWSEDDLGGDLSYLITALLYNNSINEATKKNEEREKGVRLIFKGEPLEEFMSKNRNAAEDGMGHEINIPSLEKDGGYKLMITSDGDELYYAKENNANTGSKKKKNTEGETTSIIRNIIEKILRENNIDGFIDVNSYLFSNRHENSLENVEVLWKGSYPTTEHPEIWSYKYYEYNRKGTPDENTFLSSYGRTIKNNDAEIIKNIFNIFKEQKENSGQLFDGGQVKAWEAATQKELALNGVDNNISIFEGGTEGLAHLSYIINSFIPYHTGAVIEYDDKYIYHNVFFTFRNAVKYTYKEGNEIKVADFVNLISPSKEDGNEGKNPDDGNSTTGQNGVKITINHDDGCHGNNYFGNLSLSTTGANASMASTYGRFVFSLVPNANAEANPDMQGEKIKWFLDYDQDQDLVLPYGISSDPRLNITYNWRNRFGEVYDLSITGSTTEQEKSKDEKLFGEEVTLAAKGITVFDSLKRRSMEVFVGVKDLLNSDYRTTLSMEKIDIDDETAILANLNNKAGKDINKFQYLGNATDETMNALIKSKYGDFLTTMAGSGQKKEIVRDANAVSSEIVPTTPDGEQSSGSLAADKMKQSPSGTEFNKEPELKKNIYGKAGENSEISESTMFEDILSEVFNKRLNEEDDIFDKTSNNRIRQVKKMSLREDLSLDMILDKIKEMQRKTLRETPMEKRNDIFISLTFSTVYAEIEFGRRKASEKIKEIEGDASDWPMAQYIDIATTEGINSLVYVNGMWKVRPWKQVRKRPIDPVYKVSNLGRLAIEFKDGINKKRLIYSGNNFVSGYPTVKKRKGAEELFYRTDMNGMAPGTEGFLGNGEGKKSYNIGTRSKHILVASTWKEDDCNKVINVIRSGGERDHTVPHIIVHHVNGNQTDTRPENLEWVDTRDNTIFDSGKGVALIRLYPGTGQERPIAAWPTHKNCYFVDKDGNRSNYMEDKIGDKTTMVVTLPKNIKDKARATSELKVGSIYTDNLIYIMRNVVLRDRRSFELTPQERVQDIIGYEQMVKDEPVMISNENGENHIIPTDLSEIDDKSLAALYIKGNIPWYTAYQEMNRRDEENGNSAIVAAVKEQLEELGSMDIEDRVFRMNSLKINANNYSKEDYSTVWPEGIRALDFLFTMLITGRLYPTIVSRFMMEKLGERYKDSEYYDILSGTDEQRRRDIDQFQSKVYNKYMEKTKEMNSKQDINGELNLNFNESFNVAYRLQSIIDRIGMLDD